LAGNVWPLSAIYENLQKCAHFFII
jgi:hypothetical protein